MSINRPKQLWDETQVHIISTHNRVSYKKNTGNWLSTCVRPSSSLVWISLSPSLSRNHQQKQEPELNQTGSTVSQIHNHQQQEADRTTPHSVRGHLWVDVACNLEHSADDPPGRPRGQTGNQSEKPWTVFCSNKQTSSTMFILFSLCSLSLLILSICFHSIIFSKMRPSWKNTQAGNRHWGTTSGALFSYGWLVTLLPLTF